MKDLNQVIEIYNKALSIDYSIYNPEMGEEISSYEFREFISNDLGKTAYSEGEINTAKGLMMYYFLHLTKTGGVFCDERLIKEKIGRDLTEIGCNRNEQPFYNIARTYWTLKVLVFYDIFPTEDEALRSSIAVRALQETELVMSTYFFPSMGGAGISNSDRKKNTKIELSHWNVYSNSELEHIFTQMPLYKSGSGCFIATATYDSPNAKEVMILRQWRDEYLLHSYFGRSFVKIYYVISPSIARIIKKYNFLKVLSKLVLKPIINNIKK